MKKKVNHVNAVLMLHRMNMIIRQRHLKKMLNLYFETLK